MVKTDWVDKILRIVYLGILSLFYSAMLVGSVLGVLGAYKFSYAVPAVVLMTSGLFFLFYRFLPEISRCDRDTSTSSIGNTAASFILYATSLTMILLLILIPIARWPESIAGDWFPWDAGKYHFPKAVEMFRTGSANDMTIAYSEYPFGYESLISFCLLVSRDASLFGWMHALIDLFFILSFWLLAERYSKMNAALLLFIITLVVLSNFFIQFLNPWQVFQPELLTVGKNDLLLAASILSFLFFFPYPADDEIKDRTMILAGISGMIALSVKPNAAYIIAPLWGILGAAIIWNQFKAGKKGSRKTFISFLIASLLMIPGALWLIRNLILTGRIFSENALVAAGWSIASNLSNPYFYNYIPKNVYLIIGIIFIMSLLSMKKIPQLRWPAVILNLLTVGFILTPVSAFFLRTDEPASINWRFGQAMLAYVFICLLLLFKKMFSSVKINAKKSKILLTSGEIAVVLITAVVIRSQFHILEHKPENAYILTDQFPEPVGVEGYYSAYDYVQRNVRDSVVWVENGLPYYGYGPGYTNTVSRVDSADYVILITKDWFGDGEKRLPSYFHPKKWKNYYDIVYEDPQGIVFSLKK